MIWLGPKRGNLSDWTTQRWVHLTGRRVDLAAEPWLSGPIAPTTGIAAGFFKDLARAEGLELQEPGGIPGVMSDFSELRGSSCEPADLDPGIARFYEETSAYELDVWSEWAGLFRPFGWLLAVLFSRRLQQLNIPLSSLDPSKGLTNEVLRLVDPATGRPRYTAWFRRLIGTGNVLYAGFYSVCRVPGHPDPCVKVVFPLPNGNGIVIMRAGGRSDGSLMLTSAGENFGDPGFYFTVHDASGIVRARYVRALRETIHVFPAEKGLMRADHVLKYFGLTFLRLHYRMRHQGNPGAGVEVFPAS